MYTIASSLSSFSSIRRLISNSSHCTTGYTPYRVMLTGLKNYFMNSLFAGPPSWLPIAPGPNLPPSPHFHCCYINYFLNIRAQKKGKKILHFCRKMTNFDVSFSGCLMKTFSIDIPEYATVHGGQQPNHRFLFSTSDEKYSGGAVLVRGDTRKK